MDLKSLTHPEMVALVEQSEDKEELRAVASYLELSFSGNTGVNTLKTKILEHLNDADDSDTSGDAGDADTASDGADTSAEDSGPDLEALLKETNTALAAGGSGEDDEDISDIEIAKKPKSQGYSHEELMQMDPSTIEDIPLRRRVVRAQQLYLVRCRVRNMDPADSHLEGAFFTAYNKYTGKVTKFVPFGEANEAGWHVPKIILDHLEERTYNMRKEVRTRGQASIFGIKTYKTVKMKKFAIEYLEPLTQEELDQLAKQQAASHAIDRN